MQDNVLSICNLGIAFMSDGKEDVLYKNFSYEFVPGIYTLIGESGCGKSTLMRAIVNLQSYSGQILLNGAPIGLSSHNAYMLHQHYADFPWCTVLQNVLMAYKAQRVKITKERITEATNILKTLGLGEHLSKKTGKFASEISGGQSQRVSLAVGFACRPKIFLLDEPTSALDRQNTLLVEEMLIDYQNKMNAIIIIITHDPKVPDELGARKLMMSKDFRIRENG